MYGIRRNTGNLIFVVSGKFVMVESWLLDFLPTKYDDQCNLTNQGEKAFLKLTQNKVNVKFRIKNVETLN